VHGHGDEIAGASLESGPRDVMATPASPAGSACVAPDEMIAGSVPRTEFASSMPIFTMVASKRYFPLKSLQL
jgi:hypothetical protein